MGERYRHRMRAKGSAEMSHLWAWSRQFRGDQGYMGGIDTPVMRRQRAIRQELERLGGVWTDRGSFAFRTRGDLMVFRMVWG